MPATTTERTPMVCRGLDSAGSVDFVKGRLALLGKTVALISLSFHFAIFVSTVVVAGVPLGAFLRAHETLSHLAGTLVMIVLWLVARRGRCSKGMVGGADVVAVTLLGVAWGALAVGPHPGQVMATIMAVSIAVVMRSILVPSSPVRTLIVSTLAFLPLFISAVFIADIIEIPQPPGHIIAINVRLNIILWLLAGIAVATVTSRVIYGLRRQIAEAAEIGQYTLEEKIGGGGMGEVWRARHNMLIRPAAVKLIRRTALGSVPGDPGLLMRRFEREARATAALRSPHTVQLYDFGVTDEGTLYYVMELLEGLDLETMVKKHGPLPAERAIHVLRQVCSSLADAHANGLVHRDIKPANIVVSRIGTAYDFVKVLDFGLVKLGGGRERDGDIKLTAVGSASGTPGYMAPEVALGEKETDHRVDIYALGCVAYWLVTGKMVFEADTAQKVMMDHARTPPIPPSKRVELAIPDALDGLILECLDKEPARRPATADVLSSRLEACRGSSTWTPERAERWWGAHMPSAGEARPVADILMSQEARPIKLRQARPRE